MTLLSYQEYKEITYPNPVHLNDDVYRPEPELKVGNITAKLIPC